MREITVKHAPADIIKFYPKASDLFKEHQINFCCNGANPLAITFAENDYLDEEKIMTELNQNYLQWKEEGQDIVDWDAASLSELIDHLVDKHHSYIAKELLPLEEFVARIYNVHGGHHDHLEKLYQLYTTFIEEMEAHVQMTANELFPLMKQHDSKPSEEDAQKINDLIKFSKDKLEVIENTLREIRETTNGLELPPNACGTYQVTYARLEEMEEYTLHQIHLENNILFKRF